MWKMIDLLRYSIWVKEKQTPKRARSYVIKKIKDGLKTANYDGSFNNAEAIYWFAKGLKNNPQKLDKPIQYAPLEEDLYKKIDELINLRTRPKEYYGTRTPPKIIDVPPASFEESDILTKRSTYKDYYTQQDEKEQDRLVKAKMDKIKFTPSDWEIYFDDLNDYGREKLLLELKEFLEEEVKPLVITDDYKIQFSVNGEWHSKPLTPEIFTDLLSKLTKNNFFYDLRKIRPEKLYEKAAMDLPEWSMFSAIRFCKCARTNGYRDVGWHFLRYLVDKSVPQIIRDYLE